ncbi:MAG: biopolymer transporter ExbD [Planctomycetia bacterium]|nr:biopolymer transporter ExbD [Planctomycetia bacterium]
MSIRDIKLRSDGVKLQMTSMIDVVFLLLSFFIITYKTPEIEGDFNIRMPVQVQSNQLPSLDDLTPVTIRLMSDSQGNLTGIVFGDKSLGVDFQLLRKSIFDYIQASGSVDFQQALTTSVVPAFKDDLEVEFDCDPKLRYKYTMLGITAVTGYLNGDNQVVKMVEKVKFTPPKK